MNYPTPFGRGIPCGASSFGGSRPRSKEQGIFAAEIKVMKTTIGKLPKSQIEMKIEISPEEFQESIEEALSELSKNLEMEGFRKGKVPKKIAEEKIGQEIILKEATERAIKKNYIRAILENKIEVISQPEIEVLKRPTLQKTDSGTEVSATPFIFRAKTAILPEIQLPDYKKIAAFSQKKEILVDNKEIEETCFWLQKSRAKFSQIERAAQKEDFIELEYSSPQIEDGRIQKDGFFLGQGYLIPGFEEKLEGMAAGEEKSFSLRFPETHSQKNLAGKEINFRTKMLSVQKVELPQIDDQFAKSLGNFENLKSLKENITQGLKTEKEIKESQRVRQEILDKIAERISWEIPEILITTEKNRMLEDLKINVSQKLQIGFDEYFKKVDKSEKEILESFQQDAEKMVKNSLILKEIAKKENIEAKEDEIKEKVSQALGNYPDPEKAQKEVDLERLKLYIEERIKNEKTLQFLESFSK